MGTIKLQYENELRRISRPPSTIEDLKRAAREMFQVDEPIFMYLDEENDMITVATQAEYRGALDFAAGKQLKLSVMLSDPGLGNSFIPAKSDIQLMRSSMQSAFGIGASRIEPQSLPQVQGNALESPKLQKIKANLPEDLQRVLPLGEELKQSIQEALREELSTMIVKPRTQTNSIFNFFCSRCNLGPISGVVYLCVNCPYLHLCGTCEELSDHEHAFVKVRSEGMISQVADYAQQALARGRAKIANLN